MPSVTFSQIVLLVKTLDSPLDSKEIKPVNPKGNQPWILIGRADTEAEAPILWPPDARSRFIGKDPDAGKDWGQEEKGNIGWDGWMASPTQWTWVWTNSRREWRAGKAGMLQSMGYQRVGHDLMTEQLQFSSNLSKIKFDNFTFILKNSHLLHEPFL